MAITGSNSSKTKKWLLVVPAFIIIAVLAGVFIGIKATANCGQIEVDAKALQLPQKFEHLKNERVECNNFIEGYQDKYDQIYYLSSLNTTDIMSLQGALSQLGYKVTTEPDFYRKDKNTSVSAKFGEHLSSNNQLDTAELPTDNPVYLKLEWRGPH